jgi:hypothetical protein
MSGVDPTLQQLQHSLYLVGIVVLGMDYVVTTMDAALQYGEYWDITGVPGSWETLQGYLQDLGLGS